MLLGCDGTSALFSPGAVPTERWPSYEDLPALDESSIDTAMGPIRLVYYHPNATDHHLVGSWQQGDQTWRIVVVGVLAAVARAAARDLLSATTAESVREPR